MEADMTRYVPSPRNAEEHAVLEVCLRHILDIHGEAPGYIHVWQPKSDGTNQFVLSPLPEFIDKFLDNPWEFENGLPGDLYLRQQTYRIRWWRAGTVQHTPVTSLHTVAIDLDCYKLQLTPEQAAFGALHELKLEGIPLPNHIDYSGNGTQGGVYLRWLLEPRNADTGLERSRDNKLWKDVTNRLIEYLSMFGADPQAKSLAHWFRVPGSLNSKYANDGNGAPSFREHIHEDRIDLEDLAFPLGARRLTGDLTPASSRRKIDHRRASNRTRAGTNGSHVHPNQRCLTALERLNDHRGGIGEGHRNNALYKFLCLMAGTGINPETVRQRAEEFASKFKPPLQDAEVQRTIESGLKAKPMRHSYRSLITAFDISKAEQEALEITAIPPLRDSTGQIIPENQAYHQETNRQRAMKRRRSQGVETMATANTKKSMARSKAKRKRFLEVVSKNEFTGKPNFSALGREAEIHRDTARKYWRELETGEK
jgi:hypothetical protein